MTLHEPILKRALLTFGARRQRTKMCEEMAELSVALHHFEDGKAEPGQVMDELADVLIMANQMRLHFGAAQVDAAVEYKIERLKKRIGVAA